MKKKTILILLATVLAAMIFSSGVGAQGAKEATDVPGIQYKTHIQDYGWEQNWKSNGELSGTVGESKRLEALIVELTGDLPKGATIQSYVHVENKGDLGPFKMGDMAGTSHKGLRLESIRLEINNAPGYELLYNVQVQNKGWLRDQYKDETWFKSGETAGTFGEGLRLEGFKVKLVEINKDYHNYLAIINTVKEEAYTSESWKDYQKALKNSDKVNEDSSQEALKKATVNILEAQINLLKSKETGASNGDMIIYSNVLAAVKKYDYTADSWEVYEDVLIKNVKTTEDTPAEIKAAAATILGAQRALQKVVNLTAYYKTLAAVIETDYSSESWIAYQLVVKSNVMTENNSQDQVNQAVINIERGQNTRLVRKLDFNKYNAAKSQVKQRDYIAGTWSVYQNVLNANVMTENNTQSEIDEATKRIIEAQKYLIKSADLSYYNAVLNAVWRDNYTIESWNAYQEVVRSITVNEFSTPEIVQAAVTKIMAAQLNLVPNGNMYYYNRAIRSVSDINYTSASWAAYQKVVEKNYVQERDGQAAIDAATDNIEAAQRKLVTASSVNILDYNNLVATTAGNKRFYTSASWVTYQKVVDKNIVIQRDGQAAVDKATANIQKAKEKLIKKGDLTTYTALLAKVIEADYTEKSWATYEKALKSNKMDDDKSQAEIDKAVANIEKAQDKLVEKTAEGGAISLDSIPLEAPNITLENESPELLETPSSSEEEPLIINSDLPEEQKQGQEENEALEFTPSNEEDLLAFEKTLGLYLVNQKEGGALKAQVVAETWENYEAQVEKYAGINADFSWQPTVITKDSSADLIKEATKAIEKSISDLQVKPDQFDSFESSRVQEMIAEQEK